MGIKIKVGWMKACTHDRILEYGKARGLMMISSQEYFARACSAFILNNFFFLHTLYHILWRVLFLVPHYELVHFVKSCLDMEFMEEYQEEGFLNFLSNPEFEWLNKRRLGVRKYDLKNGYTLAQLYLFFYPETDSIVKQYLYK